MPELAELIGRAKILYNDAFPGVQWRTQEKIFRFPSGARIEFGYCDTKDDVERYRGQEYCVGVDTPIQMLNGSAKRIVDIVIGDYVSTLEGPKRVTDIIKPYMAPCVRLQGEGVDQIMPVWHPVLTSLGWQSYTSILGTDSTEFEETYLEGSQPPSVDCFVKRAVSVPLMVVQANVSIEFPDVYKHVESLMDCKLRAFQLVAETQMNPQPVSVNSLPKFHLRPYVYDDELLRGECHDPLSLQDSLKDYSAYFRPYDVLSLYSQDNNLDVLPLSDDAVTRSLFYLYSDVLGNIPECNHQIEHGYLHPYDELERKTVWESSLVACKMSYVGYKLVADITVDSANHYITYNQGIVNKNSWLGIDELTMFPTEEIYNALRSSVRSTDPELRAYTRATSNPYGVGFNWVKKRFISLGPEGQTINVSIDTPIGKRTTTRKWFQSNYQDNPLVKEEYISYLASLPEKMRKRWLEGSWDGGDGAAFPDFERSIHVIKPFNIPGNWPRFRAIDYGYTTMGVCLWFAVDPEDCLYIYRELKTTLVTADEFAKMVLKAEKGEYISYGVIDGSIGANRGTTDPTLDEIMRKEGLICRYSDRSAGSRMAGKNLMHQYLAEDHNLKRPRLQIFDCCEELIDELSSLPSGELNPDDVQKKGVVDHAWDACRYGILSRPKFSSGFTYEPPPTHDHYFF
jgi:hypothetical protein